MDLAALVRKTVAIADSTTDSLQAQNIIHTPWTGSDSFGGPSYGASVVRRGVVSYKTKDRDDPGGDSILQKATVLFVGPITANGAANRKEPIDPRDQIFLPNGYTGPILSIEGVNDPGTNSLYTVKVIMG